MADAPASGAGARKGVEVQLLSRAPSGLGNPPSQHHFLPASPGLRHAAKPTPYSPASRTIMAAETRLSTPSLMNTAVR